MENPEFKNQGGLSPEELEELRKKLRAQELERQRIQKEQTDEAILKAQNAISQDDNGAQIQDHIKAEEVSEPSSGDQKVKSQDVEHLENDKIEIETSDQPEEIIPEYILGETDLNEVQDPALPDTQMPSEVSENIETTPLLKEEANNEILSQPGVEEIFNEPPTQQIEPKLDEEANPNYSERTPEEDSLFLDKTEIEHEEEIEDTSEIQETAEKNDESQILPSVEKNAVSIEEIHPQDSRSQENIPTVIQSENEGISSQSTAEVGSDNVNKSASRINLPEIPVIKNVETQKEKAEQEELSKLRAEVKEQAEEIEKQKRENREQKAEIENPDVRSSLSRPENRVPKAETLPPLNPVSNSTPKKDENKIKPTSENKPKENKNQSSELAFIFFLLLPFLVILYLYLIYFTDLNVPMENIVKDIADRVI